MSGRKSIHLVCPDGLGAILTHSVKLSICFRHGAQGMDYDFMFTKNS